MGEDATHHNSASDASLQLKFLRVSLEDPWVTMMWLVLLCASLASHALLLYFTLLYVSRLSVHQECNEVNCTPGGSSLQ